MAPRLRENAFSRRDYLVAVPVACFWLKACYNCLSNCQGLSDWVGGLVVLSFVSAVLLLAVFYIAAALAVIPGLLLISLVGRWLETSIGDERWTGEDIVSLILWAGVTAGVWMSHCKRKRQRFNGPSGITERRD